MRQHEWVGSVGLGECAECGIPEKGSHGTECHGNPKQIEAAKVQALPVTNPDSKDVLEDLLTQVYYDGTTLVNKGIADELRLRVELGLKKYGKRLQSHNDRDVLLDMRQELLDGVMYSHQAVMEGHRTAHIRNKLLELVNWLDQLRAAKW